MVTVEGALTIVVPAVPALAGLMAAAAIARHRNSLGRRILAAGMGAGGAAAGFAAVMMLAGVWNATGVLTWWNWLPETALPSYGVSFTAELDLPGAVLAAALLLAAAVWPWPSGASSPRRRHEATTALASAGLISAIVMLVLARDFVSLLVFWQISAAAAWWLVAHDPVAGDAGRRLWLTGRVADVFLVLAAVVAVSLLDSPLLPGSEPGASSNLSALLRADQDPALRLRSQALVTVMATGVLAAVTARVPLFPLLGWVRRVFATANPSAALLVTVALASAGVMVLVRLAPLLAVSPEARTIATALGSLTAVLAAITAWTQPDRRLAVGSLLVSFFAIAIAAAGTARSDPHMAAMAISVAIVLASPLVVRILNRIHSLPQIAESPRAPSLLLRLGQRLFYADEIVRYAVVVPIRAASVLTKFLDDLIRRVLEARMLSRLIRTAAAPVEPRHGGAPQYGALMLVLSAALLALLLLRGAP